MSHVTYQDERNNEVSFLDKSKWNQHWRAQSPISSSRSLKSERALYLTKRALYLTKRALYLILGHRQVESALEETESYIFISFSDIRKSPVSDEKSPISPSLSQIPVGGFSSGGESRRSK